MNNLKSAVKALEKIKSKPKTNLMTATEAMMKLKNKPNYIMDLDNAFEIAYDCKTETFSMKNNRAVIHREDYFNTGQVTHLGF